MDGKYQRLRQLQKERSEKKQRLKKLQIQAANEKEVFVPTHFRDPLLHNPDLKMQAAKRFIETFVNRNN